MRKIGAKLGVAVMRVRKKMIELENPNESSLLSDRSERENWDVKIKIGRAHV